MACPVSQVQCAYGRPVVYEEVSPTFALAESKPPAPTPAAPYPTLKQQAPKIGLYATAAGMAASTLYSLFTKSYGAMLGTLAAGGVTLYLARKYKVDL